MTIDASVRQALASSRRGADFNAQLVRNQEFQRRMQEAGVITRKQEFTIPLMERIVRVER
jgi:hypothetical protein